MLDFTIANINYEKLGRILYTKMSEEQRACVSIGMIPVETMHLATNTFKDSIADKMAGFFEIDTSDSSTIERLRAAIKPAVIKDFRRNLVLSIFAAAKAENRMIA